MQRLQRLHDGNDGHDGAHEKAAMSGSKQLNYIYLFCLFAISQKNRGYSYAKSPRISLKLPNKSYMA